MSWQILMSGLPGPMATAVAEEIGESEWDLCPTALSSPRHSGEKMVIREKQITLFPSPPAPSPTRGRGGVVAVDFSTPTAAVSNAEWFAECEIPFVMGTTGGDMAAINRTVMASKICAVVAPNMAIPIVALLIAFEHLAETCPDALRGHELRITESHQATKRDTSGTAKAMVKHLAALGLPASVEAIEKIRDPERQVSEMRVPEAHLGGHAFHRYAISAPDESLRLELRHDVVGRRVYAQGTLRAVEFLIAQMQRGKRGEVYSMRDVLTNGQ